ncbi:MAG: 4Fe-4S dicluster domain-containing protein [Candidatus Cloacimonetes bacterium]|nr:4Fe-4S dicluster domain-containing protein [Candidatus Cloacimonadota bacterium]
MAEKQKMVKIHILGEPFYVPDGLTIINALEYAGFQLTHGIGCREGFCGACGTIFREKGDYKLQAGLACQTIVSEGMYLAQIPFVPAEKPIYDITKLPPDITSFKELYPVIFRCVACNTCTKSCPQDLEVMDYVQALIKGDVEKTADLSFDCIRCGLCALRCPAEIVQYNAAILARRLCGRYLLKESRDLTNRVKEIAEGDYDTELDELVKMDEDKLKKKYYEREIKLFD